MEETPKNVQKVFQRKYSETKCHSFDFYALVIIAKNLGITVLGQTVSKI